MPSLANNYRALLELKFPKLTNQRKRLMTTVENNRWTILISICFRVACRKKSARYYENESIGTGNLGVIRTTEHRMSSEPGTVPARQRPYRMGHRERYFVKTEVGKMLEHGVIRPSPSEWASLVVLYPKGDYGLRSVSTIVESTQRQLEIRTQGCGWTTVSNRWERQSILRRSSLSGDTGKC